MRYIKLSVLFIIISFLLLRASLAEHIYIPVGEAKIKQSVLAFPHSVALEHTGLSSAEKSASRTIKDFVLSDLAFTNLFKVMSEAAFLEKEGAGITLDQFHITDWNTIGTEFLIKTAVKEAKNEVTYELRVYDVNTSKQVVGKRYVAKTNDLKTLSHTISNQIIESLTGKPGIFFTKIAMVCDKSGKKEIWTADFDGGSPKQLTSHGSLAFAPAWSHDNTKIAYSLYTKNGSNVKNIDLYELDLHSKKSKLLSNRQGINSGASYSPDDSLIALTMSFLGNPEIFLLNRVSKEVTRLTKSFGLDVDPAWSADGTKLAFVSSRSNQPMVYTMNRDGSNVKRITFAGRFNATPDWSPNGKKLVFSSELEKFFDLFMINSDGTKLERLTRNEGSNEDPRFSPDGNYVIFSSSRTGQRNIYVMSIDGMNTRRITFGLGNCEAPRWSNFQDRPF